MLRRRQGRILMEMTVEKKSAARNVGVTDEG